MEHKDLDFNSFRIFFLRLLGELKAMNNKISNVEMSKATKDRLLQDIKINTIYSIETSPIRYNNNDMFLFGLKVDINNNLDDGVTLFLPAGIERVLYEN